MATYFCDTDCELWFDKAEEENIGVIEMPYTIDGKEVMYDLGKNTDFKGFYQKMRDGSVPITSALNAEIYKEIFEPYFEKGEDILYVAFSSKMSGTFSSLDLALRELKEKYPNVRFERFDTLSISMGAGLIVYLGAKFFNANGKDIDKTLKYLESINNKVSTKLIADNLKYLAKGGRLDPNKARIGNLLSLKPILSINNEGEIDVVGKQNGMKKAMTYVVQSMKENFVAYDNAPICIIHADCENYAEDLKARIEKNFPGNEIWVQQIGPVIGAHLGPGGVGVAYPANCR